MARSSKRQCQPSISSYFGCTSSDLGSTINTHNTDPALCGFLPILPATVQSSLLNVGMRVRKSVPEGYQTRMKMSRSYDPPISHMDPSSASENSFSPSPEATPEYRGLVPYCGILKIGGLAAQPVPAEAELPPLHFDDEWSLPSSSQASGTCSVTTAPTRPSAATSPAIKKRRREDADDEDLGLESQPVSPRSRPISHTRMPNLDQIRPIALPKSRRKGSTADNIIDDRTEEREMIDVGDFDEASFFRPEDWRENFT